MPSTTLTIDVTDVGTTAAVPLGFLYEEPAKSGGPRANRGRRLWIYVFNDEAATAFAEGHVIGRDAGALTCDGVLVLANTSAANVLGVAQHAIPAGSYGFILRKGIGEVLADTGGLTADTGMIVGDAIGTADDSVGVIALVIGVALESVAAGSLATSRINCGG